eukprot:scaffold24644_cov122-Cylindrotheca_fusiformis.AAC.3
MKDQNQAGRVIDDGVPNRTPAPTDFGHMRILIARTMRKDRKKVLLWFAKFLSLPILFTLYTIGIYLGYDPEEESEAAGDYRLFDGFNFSYPQAMKLGGFDSEFVARVGESMTIPWIEINTTEILNAALLSQECEGIGWPSTEVCVFFHSENSYDLLYDGGEFVLPSEHELVGAQWAINSALGSLSNVSQVFSVNKLQRTPELITTSDVTPSLLVLLLPSCMYVLAGLIMTQFLVGPISYEKINEVSRSYLLVGVKLRSYLFQWVLYYSICGILTAALSALVSVYYNIMPMSNGWLIFVSHYLGLIQVYTVFTLVMQLVTQEELAQGVPWISGIASMCAGIPLLIYQDPDSILLTILSVISPWIGMLQYHGIYITYDTYGFNTGIQPGVNVIESGIMGNMIAQVVGILLWMTAIVIYSSPQFNDWMSGQKEPIAANEDCRRDETISGNNFEPLPPGSEPMLSVRGLEHTYFPGCCKKAEPVEVLKGLNMDICKGEVFGYLGKWPEKAEVGFVL